MKVCQVLAGDEDGGLEKHTIELSNLLAKKGVEVSVIAHPKFRADFKNVQFIPLDLVKSRRNPYILFQLYRIFKKYQFDIVHAQANKAAAMVAMVKPFVRSIKYVGTLHNEKKDVSAFNRLDCTVGVSYRIMSNIRNSRKVIYNGLDLEKLYTVSPKDLRLEFGLKNSNHPVAVSIGRYVDAKGFDLLIDAVKDIDVNLLLVGEGPLQEALQKKIEDTGQEGKIVLTGFRKDVPSLIASSDFAVIASRKEGFSYVFAEVLLHQKPLISTDVADIKRFVPHQYIVEPNNVRALAEAIKRVQQEIDRTEQIFDEYWKTAKIQFTLDTMTNAYYALYRELLYES